MPSPHHLLTAKEGKLDQGVKKKLTLSFFDKNILHPIFGFASKRDLFKTLSLVSKDWFNFVQSYPCLLAAEPGLHITILTKQYVRGLKALISASENLSSMEENLPKAYINYILDSPIKDRQLTLKFAADNLKTAGLAPTTIFIKLFPEIPKETIEEILRTMSDKKLHLVSSIPGIHAMRLGLSLTTIMDLKEEYLVQLLYTTSIGSSGKVYNFQFPRLKAFNKGLVTDKAIQSMFSPYQFGLLLDNINLLEEGVMSVDGFLEVNPWEWKDVFSPPAVRALRNKLLTLDQIRQVGFHRGLLLSDFVLLALEKKLIRPEQIMENSYALQLFISGNWGGLKALELIPFDCALQLHRNILEVLLTPEGIKALEQGLIDPVVCVDFIPKIKIPEPWYSAIIPAFYSATDFRYRQPLLDELIEHTSKSRSYGRSLMN